MYQARLQHTISLVRQGTMAENDIVPSLTAFKEVLNKDCALIIDDIWNNFRFYAAQAQNPTATSEELASMSNTIGTHEIVVPHFECHPTMNQNPLSDTK